LTFHIEKQIALKIKKKLKKIDNGVIIGLTAIIINLITVFVYMRQTNLMQQQQHAAVWPYIEWKTTYNQNIGFKLMISNNGIGPALITNMRIKLNDEVQPNLDSLFSELIGTKKFPHLATNIQKKVLPANASINLIETTDPKWSELLFIACQKNNLEIEICYESIYKDKWISTGMEVLESKCRW